jgi:subtilase family serine protease
MPAILALRHFLLTTMLLSAATTAAAAAHERGALPTQHVPEAARQGKPVGVLPQDKVLHFDMMLALGAPEQLDRFLAQVYDPASASYRHFVTPAEFTARFGPSQAAWNELLKFAAQNGFGVVGGSRDAMDLRLTGTVRAIEAAFQVKMRVYNHPREARTFFSPDVEPTVDMQSVVWHISGLDNYTLPRPRVHSRSNFTVRPLTTSGSCPGHSYCGGDMRSAYYGGSALNGAGQSVGLVEFYGFDSADLEEYFSTSGATNTVQVHAISTDGTSVSCRYVSGCDDTEQTLDMTQAIGMAPGLAQLNVYIGSTDTAILSAMSVVPSGSVTGKVDAQLSCSWGWGPADPATDDPYFKKFAAQGQSFFTAAGDSGAYTPNSEYVYPADDVYVTVVGGSDLSTTGPGGAWLAETAWADGGGGFFAADNLLLPAWQTAAIAAFNSHSSKQGSTVWRNSPDVSGEANFDYYVCADQQGCTENVYGGTSFAAPLWAGYLALVNEQAALSSQPAPGFLNPSLYALGNAAGASYAAAFHDITAGSNGYTAQVGYDLATGWGSPNGAGLIGALVGTGTSAPGFTLSAGGSVSVTAGATGTMGLTSTASGGFASAITLTASGQPVGVTVAFSPPTLTGTGTSTVSFQVSSSSPAGVYPITLTGTSGALVESATVTLTVTAAPAATFSISVSASALAVTHGTSRIYRVQTVESGSVTQTITLSVSGLPTGVTARFSPTSIKGTGASNVTLTAASTAKRGTAAVTFSGTAAATTRSSTVNLTVN